jgi:hypothetical protein
MPTARRNAGAVAELYARPPLDCVIEVACAVAEDYNARPARYTKVAKDIAGLLRGFHEKLGRDSEWPTRAQRSAHYDTLSGRQSPGGHPQTCMAEVAFLDAAEACSLGSTARGQGLLDTARTFHEYLRSSDTDAIRMAEETTGGMFARASTVLASDGVASAFGVRPPKRKAASFDSAGDIATATLIEAITRDLEPATTDVVSRYTFMVAQRFSAARRETVKQLVEGAFTSKAALDALARNAGAWARALRDFHADTVIRAWKLVKDSQRPGENLQLGMRDNPVGWRLQLDSMLDALGCAAGGT